MSTGDPLPEARLTNEGIYVGDILIPADYVTYQVRINNSWPNGTGNRPRHKVQINLLVSKVHLESDSYKYENPREEPCS